jgi:hypothetical protein
VDFINRGTIYGDVQLNVPPSIILTYTPSTQITNSLIITPDLFGAAYNPGISAMTVVIPAGYTLYGVDQPALTISDTFTNGDSLTIENSGTVAGAAGGGGYNSITGVNGKNGKESIKVLSNKSNVTVSIRNKTGGIIAGGGGGGGSGQQLGYIQYGEEGQIDAAYYQHGGGGGGGAAYYSSIVGAAGSAVGKGAYGPMVNGPSNYYGGGQRDSSPGTVPVGPVDPNTPSGGLGGTGSRGHWGWVAPNTYWDGGAGGAGGNPGQNGSDGGRGSYSGQDIGGPHYLGGGPFAGQFSLATEKGIGGLGGEAISGRFFYFNDGGNIYGSYSSL